jgi:signal transduction histidine kinase
MKEHQPPTAAQRQVRLCDFIRDNRPHILAEWEHMARRLPCAARLSQPQLLDHLPDLLEQLAHVVETVHTDEHQALEELPEVHALERLDEGFALDVVAEEYALLRTCVLKGYGEYVTAAGSGDLTVVLQELVRFNTTLDAAVITAVCRYAQARERTLVALDRISEAVRGTEDLEAFLPKLLRVMLETHEAVDTVTVMLREGDILRVRASVGQEEEVSAGLCLRVGEGFAGKVAAERRPVELRFASTDPLVSPILRARGLRALYGVPMLDEGEIIGVAHMGSCTAYEFSDEDKLLFRSMLSRATGLIVQAQLAARERAVREEAEGALAQVDALVAAAPAGLALMDTELRYVRINEALAASNGLPVEAHLGRTAVEVLPTIGRFAEPLLRRVLETGEPSKGHEFTAIPPFDPGVPHHWVCDYFPVRTRDGKVLGIGAMVMDITERRRQEEELRRTAEFRERFLGIVSHDLRGPLQSILLSANVLMRSDCVVDHHLKSVRRIATSAERMERMISDLLDFTRGRLGGGIPIHPRPMNLRHLCRHVLEELEVGHPERELRLEAPGDFRGEWDPDRLAQVFGNLGKNALDYSPARTPVSFVLRDEGDTLQVEVCNAGPPIPGELLPRIFEPFRRAEGEDRHTAGLGLGLFIVQQIIRAHGGSIAVRSTAAEGTTFSVRLPRHSGGAGHQEKEWHP